MSAYQVLHRQALAHGFDTFGVCAPVISDRNKRRLYQMVENGEHGQMQWLARHVHRRSCPKNLWNEVKSVIVLGMNYGPQINPLDQLAYKKHGLISVYARGKDYHKVMKKRLKQLAGWIVKNYQGQVKVFVDTAAIMEKPLAQSAGFGWQGKHTNVVSRHYGNWLFLGEIFTTLDLPVDSEHKDFCGSCRACQDICPTGAFPAPYVLDPTRCLSYLTIEYEGVIPHEFACVMGNRIYGCDDCLAVCPWNKFAQFSAHDELVHRDDLNLPLLMDLITFDEEKFRSFFAQSPIKRIKWRRFIRNVLIALGNSGQDEAKQAINRFLNHHDQIIKQTAQWAIAQ